MGREWYWSRSIAREEKESPGCMSGMLHYFDFHHLLFTGAGSRTTPTISSPEVHRPTSQLKGVEAPRNSLELDSAKVLSTSAIEEEFDDIPVARQLAPAPIALAKNGSLKTLLLEEERRSTQAETPRTPSVVARLMGLDLLPDRAAASPTADCQKPPHMAESKERPGQKTNNNKKKKPDSELKGSCPPPRQPLQSINCNVANKYDTGSRSLPDTPRPSTSSARPWDSDPRLSLQVNKENASTRTMQEFSYLCEVAGDYSLPPSSLPYMAQPRRKDLPVYQDENKSLRSHFYAREIVKQVKESISSRKGGNGGGGRGDENRIRSKTTRPAERKVSCDNEERVQSRSSIVSPPPSCSPPPKPAGFSEPLKSKGEDHKPKPRQPPKPPSLPTSYALLRARDQADAKAVKMVPSKCNKKASCERFTERIKKPQAPETAGRPGDPQPAPVMQKHLSDKKQCSSNVPSSVRIRSKESSPSLPSSRAQEQTWVRGVKSASTALKPGKDHRCLLPKEQDPEYGYVRSILEHARITGPVAPALKWYSSSLPIDPVIFHRLELKLPLFDDGQQGPLRHRWNRKLLFHLVEEILADLLELSGPTGCPSIRRLRRGHSSGGHPKSGEALLRQLWSQIRAFPAADCQVVGDIDALVAGDLPEAKVRRLLRHPAVAEEAEDVALEVEEEIWDSLIGEAAASLAAGR